MYASKNPYKDTFIMSSNQILETDSVYEQIDVTVIDSIQSHALPPEPNSATVSLQADSQSIETCKVFSVSIPPTSDPERYAISSRLRSSH